MENTIIAKTKENKINTNVSVIMHIGEIESNLSLIADSVDKKVEELKNTAYSGSREDRIKMMKADRADCNKAINAIEAERKKNKKEFAKPWTDFELEVKSLVAKIEEAAKNIDDQVKVLEEERRSESRKKIREYYDSIAEPVGNYKETLYQKVYETSWENVNVSMKTYKDALKKAVDDYVQGITTLKMIEAPEDIKEEAIKRFKETLDSMASVKYMAEEKQKQEELRKRIEEETKRKLEAQKQREIEEAARKAAEEERARIEAERRAEEEAKRAAEEKARQIELARIEDEMKHQKTVENEASAEESMPDGFVSTPSAFDFGLLGGNSAFDGGVPADAPVQTKDETKVNITFDADEWEIVKEYCDKMQIFYFVNK